MSDTTSTLLIKLLSTGDLTAFERGKEQSESLKVSLEGLKVALETVGVGLSFSALLEGAHALMEYGTNIKHLAEQANISTDAFQDLSNAALAVGVKGDEMGAALNTLNRNMAQAAEGATKQNRAIADLGLNTAELLAMPVEEQIQAIAKAYSEASDKGKAWADVITLIGKSSAKVRGLLNEIAEHGIDTGSMIKISSQDLERLEKAETALGKFWTNLKAIGAQMVARPLDALMMAGSAGFNPGAIAQFEANGFDSSDGSKKEKPEAEEDHQKKIERINAQLVATIQAEPQMVAAHRALEKALQDEAKAYELPAEAARRLRREADEDIENAAKLSTNTYDASSQMEAVKLRTEAAKLRTQANAEDLKASQEKAKYDSAEKEMAEQMLQLTTKLLPIHQQIFQARQHESELTKELNGLDINSLTYRADHLRIEGQIKAVKVEIAALDEKGASQMVEQQAKDQELSTRRSAIALAAIEHDYTLTDVEKWEQKKIILGNIVAEQDRYVAQMQAIANSDTLPQGARDKAGNAATQGRNSGNQTREEMTAMGPDPHSFTQNFSDGLTKLQNQWGTLQKNMASGLTGAISSGLNSVSSNISKLILGAQTLGQSFRNIAVDIGTTLVQAFVDMGVKWVAQQIMMAVTGKAIGAASTSAMIPIAMAQSAIWATPAALATIASFGGAALAAPLSILAAIGETEAMAAFEDGGFTAGREGEPAGIVHGQEFVWSAPAVRAVGAGNLERAHQAALSGGSGGDSAGGGSSGASGNIILAMSPEDVARSQRQHVDARVHKMTGRLPKARYAI